MPSLRSENLPTVSKLSVYSCCVPRRCRSPIMCFEIVAAAVSYPAQKDARPIEAPVYGSPYGPFMSFPVEL